ncbi:MAG: tungstate ABC transporter substrate-binding protein WtpA [Anaerolineae bacterium]|nr:tungstate ABC transporter substrate-binding protein WtpA [Anaerolineae bacterium]
MAALLLASIGLAACRTQPQEKVQLRMLVAGSLLVPFDELEQAFEAQHPDVDVLVEGHGSIQCVRQVTELDELADIVAVADYALIPMLMYESREPETGEPYAAWCLRFATNRLGIAYTPQSAYADEIDVDNWHEIISRPGVLLGLADPRFDACGYRALMTTQLAETYYGDATIFHRVFGGRLTPPVQTEAHESADVIHLAETLQPREDSGLVVRGSSVRLLGLLESGDLDYAFEYESVARQHGLKFLPLPVELDLSDEAHAADYARVRVSLDFQRFTSVKPEFTGGPIVYGVTIPSNAPHPDLAVEFVRFLVGSEGQAIMARNEHPMIVPPVADNTEAVPSELADLVK